MPGFDEAEAWVKAALQWLRLLVEAMGALVVALGVLVVLVALAAHLLGTRRESFTAIRLRFARYLALALELQLAADILSTAIAPSWDDIGRLAAIAVIRTALNFFLEREMRAEEASVSAARIGHPLDSA